MIAELRRQGATGIAATPHFYATHSTPERFFAKRQAAWEKLRPHLNRRTPPIRLGAEVQYFEGINRYDNLEKFCLQGTRILLLEMLVCEWTQRMVDTVLELHRRDDLLVMMAHIERYLPYGNKKAIDELWEQGVLMQVSTRYFLDKRWQAMHRLKAGKFHVLGTDSHNMNRRSPTLAEAVTVINRSRKGAEWLSELPAREKMLLNEKTQHNHRGQRPNRPVDRPGRRY